MEFHKYKTVWSIRLIIIGLLSFALNGNAVSFRPNEKFAVATSDPLATVVGRNILTAGGNAIDAAVGVGYALAVVQPCCGNIGGGGFMLIHLANGKNTVINFRETAPAAATPQAFFDSAGKPINSSTKSYSAVAVPGTVLGLNTALQKYGTWNLRRVMNPAIKLARTGYHLTDHQVDILNLSVEQFATEPNVAAIFLNHGHPFKAGELLKQKDLAKTLTLISQHGAAIFYHGKIARELAEASQQHGGLLDQQDLANYRIKEQEPLSCYYRGYQVVTLPPPASGATVCEILNITEPFSLEKLGYHTTQSVHQIVEAMRFAYADRNQYLGDADYIHIPLQKLISKKYAAHIRSQMIRNTITDSKKIGFMRNPREKQQTTAYTVADQYGNVVTVTYTLNGYFGAKVIPGHLGFFLNNEIDDFAIRQGVPNQFGLIQGKANIITPGKRPLSSISQVMIFQGDNFIATLGTPGGSTIISQIVEGIENIIDYKMNIHDAVNASRFHMQWLPDRIYMEPKVFSSQVIQALKNMGYYLQWGSPYQGLYWGTMVGILKNPHNHLFSSATQIFRKPTVVNH